MGDGGGGQTGEDVKREVKVKNGGKENTEERRFRSRGGWRSHNTGTSPPPSSPSPASIALSLRTRLFHFNKANPSYRGKLLITPPHPHPSNPPPLLLQTRAISFQHEDRMRASLRLIGEKNVKGETEKEALTAAVSGAWGGRGGGLNEKIWASAV